MLVARCPWYVAGPVLGILMVTLRAAINKPLGALGGYIELSDHAIRSSRLGFSAFLLAGTTIGGALYAISTGTNLVSRLYDGLLPSNPLLQFGILAAAGLAMGVGARTAGGCTSGHGLCGTSLGSRASIAAAMTFFATAVALAHLLAWFGVGS